jgi:hypothetical protein
MKRANERELIVLSLDQHVLRRMSRMAVANADLRGLRTQAGERAPEIRRELQTAVQSDRIAAFAMGHYDARASCA